MRIRKTSRVPAREGAQGGLVIGIDFGTLSARALLLEARTGRELASATSAYRDGVIETTLPGSAARLKPQTALQNPRDYLTALDKIVPGVLRAAGVKGSDVAGLGIDFTSCTMLPVTGAGEPLCFDTRWSKNPHAWVKLWKHHAAQAQADRINATAHRRREPWIAAYGGKYSSEWFFAKVLETLDEAPAVYRAAAFFVEAGDWIVWQLTGRPTRCVSAAGFKGMRVASGPEGWTYPSPAYFRALHPELEQVVRDKLTGEFVQLGSVAGGLRAGLARRWGLPEGLPVAAGNIDAHAAVPACGVTQPGDLVMMMGTSTCHLLIAEARQEVEGLCGVVEDGVVPGAWGYEAGQAGVGDLFAWYVEHGVPGSVERAAARSKRSVHEFLAAESARLRPAESGLLALDWWNGNRSVLMDAHLTGMLLGCTLATRPSHIYRALLEATAFGTRTILEAFESKRLPVRRVFASGGLAQKSPLLMQIYADVIQRPIAISATEQGSAFGAAMYAAVAAGLHRDIAAAAQRMVRPARETVRPNRAQRAAYDGLYREYQRMHDWLGRDPESPMRALHRLQHGL